MGKHRKFYERVMGARVDADISFNDLRRLLVRLGFVERIRGDHYIFTQEGVQEIINLQPKGALAKPYQVKQVRSLLIRYGLVEKEEE